MAGEVIHEYFQWTWNSNFSHAHRCIHTHMYMHLEYKLFISKMLPSFMSWFKAAQYSSLVTDSWRQEPWVLHPFGPRGSVGLICRGRNATFCPLSLLVWGCSLWSRLQSLGSSYPWECASPCCRQRWLLVTCTQPLLSKYSNRTVCFHTGPLKDGCESTRKVLKQRDKSTGLGTLATVYTFR